MMKECMYNDALERKLIKVQNIKGVCELSLGKLPREGRILEWKYSSIEGKREYFLTKENSTAIP